MAFLSILVVLFIIIVVALFSTCQMVTRTKLALEDKYFELKLMSTVT